MKCILRREKCDLTYKEYELLKYLIMNEGIVLTRDRLMEKSGAWISYRRIPYIGYAHIKTLRQKLGPSGKLIQTVRNVGYSLNHIRD